MLGNIHSSDVEVEHKAPRKPDHGGVVELWDYRAPCPICQAFRGEMEVGASFPRSQGVGEAAHQQLQLPHQPEHQEHRDDQSEGHEHRGPDVLPEVP